MENKKVWILVEVYRGLANSVTVFKTRRAALAGTKKMRASMNLDYDETGLFEVDLEDVLSPKRIMVDEQICIEEAAA